MLLTSNGEKYTATITSLKDVRFDRSIRYDCCCFRICEVENLFLDRQIKLIILEKYKKGTTGHDVIFRCTLKIMDAFSLSALISSYLYFSEKKNIETFNYNIDGKDLKAKDQRAHSENAL